MFREWKRGDWQKKLWNGVHQEEENEVELNLPVRKGIEGSRNDGRKGINGRRLEWQRQLEEENNIIVNWAQEDVETLCSLLISSSSSSSSPPCIRSFELFRHRRIAIVSWGVHGLFFLEVCSWGRVSVIWCCPFFQGGWSSFVCIWVSRLVFQRSLVLSLWLRFLFYPALCIP